MRTGNGVKAIASPGRKNQPISPPATIAPTWPSVDGTVSASTVAAAAIASRSRSGQRFFAMPHTACATTATATIFRPCSQPASGEIADRGDAVAERRSSPAPTAG